MNKVFLSQEDTFTNNMDTAAEVKVGDVKIKDVETVSDSFENDQGLRNRKKPQQGKKNKKSKEDQKPLLQSSMNRKHRSQNKKKKQYLAVVTDQVVDVNIEKNQLVKNQDDDLKCQIKGDVDEVKPMTNGTAEKKCNQELSDENIEDEEDDDDVSEADSLKAQLLKAQRHDREFLLQDREAKNAIKNWDLGMTKEEQEEYRRIIMTDSMDIARGGTDASAVRRQMPQRPSQLETLLSSGYRIIMMIIMAYLFKSMMRKMKEPKEPKHHWRRWFPVVKEGFFGGHAIRRPCLALLSSKETCTLLLNRLS